jgi:hypothetical protein
MPIPVSEVISDVGTTRNENLDHHHVQHRARAQFGTMCRLVNELAPGVSVTVRPDRRGPSAPPNAVLPRTRQRDAAASDEDRAG